MISPCTVSGRLRFASLLLLSLALLSSAPRISSAQTESTAAQTQLTSAPPTQPAENKSEADERNEYRHSATVKWFANLLHVDVETAAITFEYINFAVVVLAIGIPLFKIVPGLMRKRSARLSVDLEVAQARTDDANTRLRAVETKLSGLDGEIAALRKQMEEDMRADEVRSKAQLEEETARLVAAAEQEIVMAGSMAQRELKQFAADLAIDRAMQQLTLDSETDRALFAEFAADVAGGRFGSPAKTSGNSGASKGEHTA